METKEYDYLIIGGGSAGSVLGNPFPKIQIMKFWSWKPVAKTRGGMFTSKCQLP